MGINVLLPHLAALLLCGLCSASNDEPLSKAGACWAMGDPHYRTFDGQYINFMGNCTYLMAKNCDVDDDHPAFQVETRNANRFGLQVTSAGAVFITIYDTAISIVRSEFGRVRLEDEIWSLPVIVQNGKSKTILYQSGMSIILEADFGLMVQYDWEEYILITVTDSYAGRMCGLCGNFNGNLKDDLTTPNGSEADSIVALGKSWKVPSGPGDTSCQDECSAQCENCKNTGLKRTEADVFCDVLTHIMDGPFRRCQDIIEPKLYKEMCLYDFCMGKGVKEELCNTLEVYADACQRVGIKVFDWRKLAGCLDPKCPANSHYQLCGNPCPATCGEPKLTSSCNVDCVETCACDPGYMLSGNQCVLPSECGCWYQGRYVQAGATFWGDVSCGKRCTCNAGGNLTCQDTSCQTGEQCQVVNGVRDCYPVPHATCMTYGDPHYSTFDGDQYTFQGTCVYQMASVCSKNASLELFDVLVQNEFDGNKFSSSINLIEVKVYGQTIVISREYPGSVMVNGELFSLPLIMVDKVFIYMSGFSATIQTDFGVKVSYDWNSLAFVVVPETYKGAMCGMCGNYNSNPQDDMQMRNGKIAATGKDMGESWNVADIPGCVHGCQGHCPTCNFFQKIWYESHHYCGLLKDDHGPLSSCFSKVDPTDYYQNCMNDVCLNEGEGQTQCKVLAAYVAMCQNNGVQVSEWRSKSFCDKQCPASSHYSLCASGCPATCGNFSPPIGCDVFCKESCVCDEGFILSGVKCVPVNKCGCTVNGTYYNHGQTFYPKGNCEKQCKCSENGNVACETLSCGAHEKCEIKDGVRGCYPFTKGVCSIYGDPHYNTFDNNTYDFQGTCTYVAAKACHLEGTQLTPFTVVVENERWYPQSSRNVSVAKLVTVEVYGNTLILRRNQVGLIMVNGILTNLPVKLSFGVVEAYQDGSYDVIKTDFGLTVKYDLVYHVIITVPPNYEGKTCGLCGNFNYNSTDDFQLPDGQTTKDLLTFGAAWEVSVTGVVCDNGCSGDICPTCDEGKNDQFQKECGLLTNPEGPFANCQKVIDPSSYFRDCVFDMCMSDGDSDVLCHSISTYVADCQNIGIDIKNWRTATFCQFLCPVNSHYEICQETCFMRCPGLSSMLKCVASCSEGCECNTGYYYNGTGCVTWDQCSCYADGLTFKIGEHVRSEDCQKICTCMASGAVVCQAAECGSDETCQIRNGVRGCYKTQCLVEAGGTFTLFNGLSGVITTSGSYNIVEFCDQTVLDEWFRVVADVQMCGQTAATSVVAVYTFFENMLITINYNQEVWVNGRNVSLPAMLENEISVSVSDTGVIITNKSGLLVTYSVSLDLNITVSSELSSKVCGACGQVKPTIVGLSSLQTYMDSWRAADFPTCT